ncbi:MAG: type II toxin-antitoxin system RelE family toxin [Candidatus Bipolaricaulaceae bacterium]
MRLRGEALNLHRLRLGEYRVVLQLEEDTIYVLRVVSRQDLEKAIRQLLQR